LHNNIAIELTLCNWLAAKPNNLDNLVSKLTLNYRPNSSNKGGFKAPVVLPAAKAKRTATA
jgi:hypothetical protein